MNPTGSGIRREGLARGALVITLAGFVARVLGAVYKPVVARLFAPYDGHGGDAGLGLVQVPAPAYLLLLSLSAGGVNVAISHLVAGRMARGDGAGARRVFRTAVALLAGLGAVLAAAFYAASGWLARLAGRPETAAGFRATAPAVFLVAVMAAYRGLFQGLQQMTAYALSQVWEQVARVVTGILLVWWLVPYGVPLGAAGYNFGAVTGALAGLAYLMWLYARSRPVLWGEPSAPAAAPAQEEGACAIARRILALAGPVAVIGAVQPLILLVDSLLVIPRLEAGGVVGDQADKLLGQLGNAFAIVWLPAMVTHALYVSLVPAIAAALAAGQVAAAQQRAAVALKVTLAVGLPATVGLWLMPDPIYRTLFLGDGGPVLQAAALATLPMMVQQTTAGILQGAGDATTPTRTFLLALAAKLGLTWWWTATPLAARGAAYASAVAFGLTAALNLWAVQRQLGVRLDAAPVLGMAGAAAVMGAVAWWAQPRLAHLAHSTAVGTLAAVALGAAVYGVALPALGGVGAQDLALVPRLGRPLAGWLQRWRILRG